ncbi:MAG: adenylate/guanylate cyclase domain-containing protein [Gemmataceae bacterium]|nr:adenylate/guanylate cyclase domain-containing protein [Gemmataceae bacterium]
MLQFRVSNDKQHVQFDHSDGPIEFGRRRGGSLPRFVLEDKYVSRNHLRIEELPRGRVRIDNLSTRTPVKLTPSHSVAPGGSLETELPLSLTIATTRLCIEAVHDEPFESEGLLTVTASGHGLRRESPPSLRDLGDAPEAQALTHWLEMVIELQRAPDGSEEFYTQTARALVDLVGLDQGLVLLRHDSGWDMAAWHGTTADGARFSRTLVNHVVGERRTVYQDPRVLPFQTETLVQTDAVVASPIFGPDAVVAGVLYGLRQGGPGRCIRPLEAQVVQLLAAAAGAHLARTIATRTRTQFEQFFSVELARELERNPNLLEGRHQEVTILASDLRDFTSLSEQLGGPVISRLARDLMDRLSEQIAQHGGVIVDYAGDGILAMWNAPIPREDHAASACQAALAMRAELPGLNARWQAVVRAPLDLGIGLNTGPAFVGNTGSRHRFKYGPIGHTVNLASRVQAMTKKLGVPVLLTPSVRDQLPRSLATQRVARVSLPGIADAVALYDLAASSVPQASSDDLHAME